MSAVQWGLPWTRKKRHATASAEPRRPGRVQEARTLCSPPGGAPRSVYYGDDFPELDSPAVMAVPACKFCERKAAS